MPEQITDAQLDEWQGLADDADRGPWTMGARGGVLSPSGDPIYFGEYGSDGLAAEPDARFIAAARTIVPALIAEVRELRRLLAVAHSARDKLVEAQQVPIRRAEQAEERAEARVQRYISAHRALSDSLAAMQAVEDLVSRAERKGNEELWTDDVRAALDGEAGA